MKKRLKLVLVVLSVVLGLLVVAVLATIWQHHNSMRREGICLQKPGSISVCDISLEVADDQASQEKGLGGRESLPDDKGMLFAFEGSEVRCFWMKDMNFSIDILWLDEKDTIVAKEVNVSPDTYPKSFCPEQPAHSVVELNANVAKDWSVGMSLKFVSVADQ